MNYEHSKPSEEMTGSSMNYTFTRLEVLMETLMEDIKHVNTEKWFESRDESILIALFGLLGLLRLQ